MVYINFIHVWNITEIKKETHAESFSFYGVFITAFSSLSSSLYFVAMQQQYFFDAYLKTTLSGPAVSLSLVVVVG